MKALGIDHVRGNVKNSHFCCGEQGWKIPWNNGPDDPKRNITRCNPPLLIIFDDLLWKIQPRHAPHPFNSSIHLECGLEDLAALAFIS